jgi:hypothetical protein
MTKIDGTILAKKGDTREYDFDLKLSLRTGQQKKALSNLLRARAIKLTVTDQLAVVDTGPSKGAMTSVDSSPESLESLESQEPPPVDDLSSYSSIDDIESSSSSEDAEEQEAQTSVPASVESTPSPAESGADAEEPEADTPAGEGSDGADAEGDGRATDEPADDPEDGDQPEVDVEAIEQAIAAKFDKLNAIHGLGLKTVEKLIELDNPATHESVSSVPRIKPEMIPEILAILNG